MTGTGGPLEGFRVVDLTSNFTGPMATMLLADQGADVVKVEASSGDVVRALGARSTGGSPFFANLNRGKRSIAVDLSTKSGRDVVSRLTANADVFMQNFRPGVIERLGLSAEELRGHNDRLVYVSINGFGASGPRAGSPAYDQVVQALSGMAAIQSSAAGGAPELIRHTVIDKTTGYVAAQATLAALLQRSRTGTGAHVEVSMLDVALHLLWPDGMVDQTCLEGPPVGGIARTFRLTATADGHVSIIAITDAQFRGLMNAAGCTEILGDPELQTLTGRHRSGGDAMRTAAAALAELTTEEVLARLEAHGVPCAPALTTRDVPHDPQVVASGSLLEIDHPELGRIRQPRSPAMIDGEAGCASPSRMLGQDTDEILRDLGWTNAEITDAKAAGVVA